MQIFKRYYRFFILPLLAFIIAFFITLTISDKAFSLIDDNLKAEKSIELPEVDKSIQSDLPAGNYYISVSYNIRMLLDVTGGSSKDGTNIELFTNNAENAQKFRIKYDNKGYATIYNYSGKVLDVCNGAAKPESNVIQFTNNNTINQKWIITKESAGTYKIKSALSEISKVELCLDVCQSLSVDGANVQIFQNTNGANQRFIFTPIDSQKFSGSNDLEDGEYYIKMKKNKNFCAEINGSLMSDCAHLQLWSYHGSQNQIFHFQYEASTGCYLIYNVNSGKLLNVEKSNPIPLANVIQFKYTNDDNERWALTKRLDDGSWIIKNRHTGLVLDIEEAKVANGTNIETFTSNNGNAQRFTLEKAKLLNSGIYSIRSYISENLNVEVPASSWRESEQLVLYSNNLSYNQKYSINVINDNEFTMRSVISGKYIAQKSNKVIQTDKFDDNAKWKLIWNNKGLMVQNNGNGLYMDVTGYGLNSSIITKKNDSSANEYFGFIKTDLSTLGTYNICPACNLNNSLNINGGSWWGGAQIFSWAGYDTNNCKWNIQCVGNSLYRIVSSMTEYVIDVKNGACHDLDQIQQYSWNGGSPQLWRVEFTDDGWFNFVNVTNGLLLDCFNQSTYSGAPVGVCHRNYGNAQKWRFRLASDVTFSGNAELDAHLRNICRACPSLDSAYNFVAGYAYRDGDLWPGGDWTIPYALEMIHCGSGNCYRYAALFMWCARALGFSANAHCGELGTRGGGRQAHGWVEVYNGGTYVCDPELQHVLGQYNFYMITYASAPVIYYP